MFNYCENYSETPIGAAFHDIAIPTSKTATKRHEIMLKKIRQHFLVAFSSRHHQNQK